MGYGDYDSRNKIFLRAARAFLCLPKSTPSVAVTAEIGWLEPRFRTQIKMVRQYNCVISMSDSRLTKVIVKWDENLSNLVTFNTWSSEIKQIFADNNMLDIHERKSSFPQQQVIQSLKSSMLCSQSDSQKILSQTYSKLKYFVHFKDFQAQASFLTKHLSYLQMKNFCRARIGILPINDEILRYSRPIVPADKRYCDVCTKSSEPTSQSVTQQSRPLENLEHCMFQCICYSDLRTVWLSSLLLPSNFNSLPLSNKFDIIFNKPENVKPTANFIIAFMNKRSLLLNKQK